MDVDAIAIDGIWWRQTPHGGDPLYRADPPSDGRWQRGETVGGLYFADSEKTTWAEWYRALAEFAIPPDRQMPRDLWRWRVDANQIADLTDADRLVTVGLTTPRPTQREWLAFQKLGEQLWRDGYRGVLAPSAARPEKRILCLFARWTTCLMPRLYARRLRTDARRPRRPEWQPDSRARASSAYSGPRLLRRLRRARLEGVRLLRVPHAQPSGRRRSDAADLQRSPPASRRARRQP